MENEKLENQILRAGADIGSTTVKLVVLDKEGTILYSAYRRHMAQTRQTLIALMKEVLEKLGDRRMTLSLTGSGALGLSRTLNIPFVQEVVAVASALKKLEPLTDVAVELGGEDAKIIYFGNGIEERMNGVCAGGTGSFIDQMASLIQTDATGLNDLAADAVQIYPIASRCGVFAKTDIQPLINDGVSRSDIAASILQAVVNQTISGLACGHPIRGHVAFLGGPLHFLPELKKAFIKTLKLTPDEVIDPENAHLFAAYGAADAETREDPEKLSDLIGTFSMNVDAAFETKRLKPLFSDDADYQAFLDRHAQAKVERADIRTYTGDCFLGIDAGSTTTKAVLIGSRGELLFSYYAGNSGDPIKTAMDAMAKLREELPEGAHIARACSTGYGEALLKTAFSLDDGEVETIAHATAAGFFLPEVDCVLDIGGQDMKCIRLKDGNVDSIMLNEACSSGCGSFIENFASSLGMSAEEFAKEAVSSRSPVDLGTRCTVFMNSNVKQAQKEGAEVSDISAGLAYSVIKNALYKVIKITDAKNLGRHIVVQGGTFYNHAVLRALEILTGTEVICPDISGLMGAFGAALVAKDHWHGQPSSILSFDEIRDLEYHSRAQRCGGCGNNCLLTINTFSGGKRYITGNRCEKMVGGSGTKHGVDLFEYKQERVFGYESLSEEEAERGVIGIPRALNIYENYPFWATFFKALRFRVVLSPFASRSIYSLGMDSIPSDTECYPAKLTHGAVKWLIDQHIETIFHPSVFYEHQETEGTQNRYNCPMVISYPENIRNNMEELKGTRYIHPFLSFTGEKKAEEGLVRVCKDEWNIPASEVKKAVQLAWAEQLAFKDDMRKKGEEVLRQMEKEGSRGIVLAGRPYHIDPEINHGIPGMIASYGLNVFTEDSLPLIENKDTPLRVLNQWIYHARLYNAARFAAGRSDMELVQLNSFGCGLDAVTTDQVNEILSRAGKLYTLLKIDEVNNLGATRIRIRSLLAAMEHEADTCSETENYSYERAEFTEEMYREGYTLLAPDMSPLHMDMLVPLFRRYGYNVVILNDVTRNAIDLGLKYVNNDACYPSIITTGLMMEAVLSGKYDTDHLALMMTQTGGCCRASNYVGFIRRALDQAGLSQIPVISLSVGVETNPGFHIKPGLLKDAVEGIILGDLIMKCLYRVRPYEKEKGSANALKDKWQDICSRKLGGEKTGYSFSDLCSNIVKEFDELPIDETLKKPRVGIVGEILVKYMPIANNYLVDLLEAEGAEAVVPAMMDFFDMILYNTGFKYKYLDTTYMGFVVSKLGHDVIAGMKKPAEKALKKSRRFSEGMPISEIAKGAEPFLSIGNQYGEGWLLCGEMVELIRTGVPNVVCVQPFGCLPNHVVGKGVIKALKNAYPEANIAAVDYDPGASEVNQLNRIKLMLSSAREKLGITEAE